jgi:hypothetical protein
MYCLALLLQRLRLDKMLRTLGKSSLRATVAAVKPKFTLSAATGKEVAASLVTPDLGQKFPVRSPRFPVPPK